MDNPILSLFQSFALFNGDGSEHAVFAVDWEMLNGHSVAGRG
jgi:hypothetical protein